MEADDAQSKQRLLQHLANQKATKQLFRDELGLPTTDIDEDIKETQRKLARLSEGGLEAAPGDAADARLRNHEHRQTLAALAKTQGEAGAQSHIPRAFAAQLYHAACWGGRVHDAQGGRRGAQPRGDQRAGRVPPVRRKVFHPPRGFV